MSMDETKEVVRRLFELHDEGDLDLVKTVVSADCVFHMPDAASNVVGPEDRGRIK